MRIRKTKDITLKESIETSLKANGYYCPCRREKTVDTKCMCKSFRDQIKNGIPGFCHCGLYEAYLEEVNND